MKDNDETSFLLTIDKQIWENFKAVITKNKTLNEALVELIKEKINNG